MLEIYKVHNWWEVLDGITLVGKIVYFPLTKSWYFDTEETITFTSNDLDQISRKLRELNHEQL